MNDSTPPITVLCTLGLAGVMAQLAPRFEAESGCPLALRLGPAHALVAEIEAGAPFDVAILTATALDALAGRDKIVPGSRADIARSCVGVTIPPGAAKPDISTVAAFTGALLQARSIIFTALGASGQHFASILPRLGIEQEVRRKATVRDGLVAEAVVRGEFDLGIQQVSEILAVAGAILLGPIPDAVQKYTVFAAGLGTAARNPAAAARLLRRLADASTLELAVSKGMEPPA